MIETFERVIPKNAPGMLRRTRAPKSHRLMKALLNPVAIKRALFRQSFYEFFKYFWDEVANSEFEDNWHIKYLCDTLQDAFEWQLAGYDKKYDIIINIPPGSTKTTIVSIMFPVWVWTVRPEHKFITSSYSSALSLEAAEQSRDLFKSDKFRAIYPELKIKQDKDSKSNYRIVREMIRPDNFKVITKQAGQRFSTSVGGSLTGFHGDILIIDDPINPKQAVSPVQLKTANDWISNTLITRRLSKKRSIYILVMQRLHENDPTGFLLSRQKDIFHICLPGELNNYEKFVKPAELKANYQNGLLDANRLDYKVLQSLRDIMGTYGYAGQIGQNPVPPEGGMFKVDRFNYLDRPFAAVNYVQTVRYWDKAGTQDGGAYTVGVKMSKLRDGKFIVEDVKRGQWSSGEREKIIRATAEADGEHVMVYVEQEPGSGGKESAENTIRNLAGFSVHADRPTGDKTFRADPYAVQVEAGNVYLMRAPWNQNYIDELKYFPNGTYKDQVDASSGAFHALVKKKQVRRIR